MHITWTRLVAVVLAAVFTLGSLPAAAWAAPTVVKPVSRSETLAQLDELVTVLNLWRRMRCGRDRDGRWRCRPVQPEQPPTQPPPQPPPQPPAPPPDQPKDDGGIPRVDGLTSYEDRMVNLINQERRKEGLANLKVNADLRAVARVKSKDMVDNNYFSHTSPKYGSLRQLLRTFGISYRVAAENLAVADTPDRAHTMLMGSDGHRRNILDARLSEVGVGIVRGKGGIVVTQLFIGH